jgi:hypothetical protein
MQSRVTEFGGFDVGIKRPADGRTTVCLSRSWATENIFGMLKIAPPGQEGWREAPGWWFNLDKDLEPLHFSRAGIYVFGD